MLDAARPDFETKSRLTELIARHAHTPGKVEGAIPDVEFYRAEEPTECRPVVYRPCIIIVAQGSKCGLLGDNRYEYNAYNYLVLSVPLPLVAHVAEASPENPFLSMCISVDPVMLGDLLIDLDEDALEFDDDTGTHPGGRQYNASSVAMEQAIHAAPLTAHIASAAVRLIEAMDHETERKVLARQIMREIIYRVLVGERGACLRAAARRGGKFHQLAEVLRTLHADYNQAFSVHDMAAIAGMSATAFHANFKAITSMTPLQYLKNIRLHQARNMMIRDGLNASTAAFRVGYASPFQFSREYKRLFGAPPSREIRDMVPEHVF